MHAILSSAKLFTRIPKGKKRRSFTTTPQEDEVSKRLEKFAADPAFKFSRQVSGSRSPSRDQLAQSSDAIRKLRAKVTAFMQAGCLGKALSLLITPKAERFAGTEDEKIQCLASQHPTESDVAFPSRMAPSSSPLT